MRSECPACANPRRLDNWSLDFLVPDGWPQPTHNTVCLCTSCGLIYYDNDKTAADYDQYYRQYYGYDGNLNIDQNNVRLDSVMDLVKRYFPTYFKIVDFGGGNGYLERRLQRDGYTDVHTVRVDDELPDNVNLVIATQVFEHLYDLRGTLDRLLNCMIARGIFLIEVPDALEMTFMTGSAIKDYQQKHCNHFAPFVLDRLFSFIGYDRFYSEQGEMTGYFGKYYRAIYNRNVPIDMYATSRVHIEQNVKEKVAKLEAIGDKPVIVWGCGDLAMHLLTKVKLNVVYYVDNDPAFRGQWIGGIPVAESVFGGDPYSIVIMAQNQATALLKRIHDLGLTNEVIVI
jgi:hypothetical protein